MSTKMKPKHVAILFTEAVETFPVIVGRPTDANLHNLCEALFTLLLDILYDK